MSNQHSCIHLRIESIIYDIIGFSAWSLRKSKGCPVVKFRYSALLAVAVDLNLFGIDLVCTTKPCLCYP